MKRVSLIMLLLAILFVYVLIGYYLLEKTPVNLGVIILYIIVISLVARIWAIHFNPSDRFFRNRFYWHAAGFGLILIGYFFFDDLMAEGLKDGWYASFVTGLILAPFIYYFVLSRRRDLKMLLKKKGITAGKDEITAFGKILSDGVWKRGAFILSGNRLRFIGNRPDDDIPFQLRDLPVELVSGRSLFKGKIKLGEHHYLGVVYPRYWFKKLLEAGNEQGDSLPLA